MDHGFLSRQFFIISLIKMENFISCEGIGFGKTDNCLKKKSDTKKKVQLLQ